MNEKPLNSKVLISFVEYERLQRIAQKYEDLINKTGNSSFILPL